MMPITFVLFKEYHYFYNPFEAILLNSIEVPWEWPGVNGGGVLLTDAQAVSFSLKIIVESLIGSIQIPTSKQ